jgi:hypothetical protein
MGKEATEGIKSNAEKEIKGTASFCCASTRAEAHLLFTSL